MASSEDIDWAFEDSKRYPISNDYRVERDLGEGKFSIVRYAIHKQSGEEVAIKCIDRINTNPDELVHEAMLMQLVEGHPGIIKIKDVYEDTKNFYLVMEFIAGGELFDRIVQQDSYSEKEAATVVRQICSIVQYVHSKGVVHRDIKPENLLYADKDATELKLCDFGLADTIEDNELLTAIVGSTTYMAPEVAKGIGYDKSVDLYSVGVILYILLCGYPPFEPEAGIVDLEFPVKEWGEMSKPVIELIKNMLSADCSKRPTATQLLQHSWIKGEAVSTRKLTGTIKTIKKYQVAHKTGQTMRVQDPITKAPVWNMFDEPEETKEIAKAETAKDQEKSNPKEKKKDKEKEKQTREKREKRSQEKEAKKNKRDSKVLKKSAGDGAPPVAVVSFIEPVRETQTNGEAKKDGQIKTLQKELEEEKKKVKQLEVKLAELEKKPEKKPDKKKAGKKK